MLASQYLVTISGLRNGKLRVKIEYILSQLHEALNLTPEATLHKCPSGAVNHVYQLCDVNLHAAVKWLGDDDFSGVNRQQQFQLQKSLSDLGAAPVPFWLSEDATIWAEQWVHQSEGQVKTGEADKEKGTQSHASLTPAKMAKVLAQLHALPVDGPKLHLHERWHHYITIANLDRRSDLFCKACDLEDAVIRSENDKRDVVLCHNDLLEAHVLEYSSSPPMVVDWEYGAVGNRYFDIASCCLINSYTHNESLELISAYADIVGISYKAALQQYSLFEKIVSVTNALWNAALVKTSSDNMV